MEALEQLRPLPDWLRRHRQQAWEQYQSLPLPARDHEEWRRTDIRAFHLDEFTPAALAPEPASGAEAFATLLPPSDALAGVTVHADGRVVRKELDPQWAQRGVLFGSLEELAAENGATLEPFFGRCVDSGYDKLAALQAAFGTGGTVLYVPRGVAIDRPLCSLSGLTAAGLGDTGRLLVVVEEGASATLFHQTASGPCDAAGLHVGVVELFVAPGARLQFISLQDWNQSVWNFSHQRALVERGGSLQWTVAALGSRLAKVNQEVVLEGNGASAEINGVLFTSAGQHFSYHTRQHHRAAATHSNLLYKGALKDRSRSVWRGMIRVEPEAQKTDAYQRNDNLLLSAAARADSIPGLEIEADDVRCTHGATAGRVDDDQVFYATSRGLTLAEAIHMIVEGFFRSAYDRVGSEPVRDALRRAVARKIGIPTQPDPD